MEGRPRDVGKIILFNNDSWSGEQEKKICICIKKYGKYYWEPVTELSGANWLRYRRSIAKAMAAAAQDPTGLTVEELLPMLRDLYESSHLESSLVLEKHPSARFCICSGCKKFDTGEKRKCIHTDCTGLCKVCYDKLDLECPGCGRAQMTPCPICKEDKHTERLMCNPSCGHYVCWECYGRAYRYGKALEKCPLCRSNIDPWDAVLTKAASDGVPELPRRVGIFAAASFQSVHERSPQHRRNVPLIQAPPTLWDSADEVEDGSLSVARGAEAEVEAIADWMAIAAANLT